ncbi:MAG: thiamine phosphate synthase [Epsilonproteobacteria bacterium]|nr:thiamine phosphate synthase [Campylobacterota bacterium]
MFSYLITDPNYYQDFQTTLTQAIIKHNPDFICFRDKFSTKNAKSAVEIAKYYDIPIFVNQYTELLGLGFDGVHLTSNQLHLINHYTQCLTCASTHSLQEVQQAQNSDFITFSPVFKSKGRDGLGIEMLNQIVNSTNSKVFGLGGIVSEKEVSAIKHSKAYGFASIRYFIS